MRGWLLSLEFPLREEVQPRQVPTSKPLWAPTKSQKSFFLFVCFVRETTQLSEKWQQQQAEKRVLRKKEKYEEEEEEPSLQRCGIHGPWPNTAQPVFISGGILFVSTHEQ